MLSYTSPVGNSSRSFPPRLNYSSQQQNYSNLHQQSTPSPSQYNQYQIPPEMRRIDENVIRLPRGPDGSTGFMLKR